MQPIFVSSTLILLYPSVSGANFCNLYVLNHWVTLHPWVSNLKCSLLVSSTFRITFYRRLMVVQTLLQGMFVKSTYGITCLVSSYECHLKCSLYLLVVHLQNHCVTLQLWVSNLKRSICLWALPWEWLGYTTLMGAPPLERGYVGKLYLLNDWVTLHVWVRHSKCSLFLQALPTESLGYITLVCAKL